MSKDIAKTWWFPSSSNPNNDYETLQYTDGSTSCNCKGWTMGGKRLDANGNRTCKHTRLVDAGLADAQAKRFVEYKAVQTQSHRTTQTTPVKQTSKEKLSVNKARKIVW